MLLLSLWLMAVGKPHLVEIPSVGEGEGTEWVPMAERGAEVVPLAAGNTPPVRPAQRFLIIHRLLHGTMEAEESARKPIGVAIQQYGAARLDDPIVLTWLSDSGHLGTAPPAG